MKDLVDRDPAPTARPPTRADARANRARILEAAYEVFRQRGLEAEMREIGERAGVGTGTLYRHFPTRDDLVAAIVGEFVDRIRTALDAAKRATDPVDAVRMLLAEGFRIADYYGDMAQLFHGQLPAACAGQFEGFDAFGSVAELVRQGIAAGGFRPELDPEIAAARLVSSFAPHFYRRLRLTHTMEQVVQGHVDFFLRGVG